MRNCHKVLVAGSAAFALALIYAPWRYGNIPLPYSLATPLRPPVRGITFYPPVSVNVDAPDLDPGTSQQIADAALADYQAASTRLGASSVRLSVDWDRLLPTLAVIALVTSWGWYRTRRS